MSKKNPPEVGTLPATSTDKQRRFVEEYCVDFNATQATVRAGYSENGAGQAGHRLLKNVEIRAAIQERLNELTMSCAEAAMRLTRWGRGSVASFLRITVDGEAIIDLSTDEAQAAFDLIRRIKTTEHTITSKDGSEYTTVRTEIELHDAKDAVIQMAKLHGMFSEDGPGRTTSTREDVAEMWRRLKMIKGIEELEQLMVATINETGGKSHGALG